MNKDEIILTIESLPTDIENFKLFIYENKELESWGLICNAGKLNKTKLLDIFDSNNKIKKYVIGNNLEYQFTIDYVKNEEHLFTKTINGNMTNGLTIIQKQITELDV